MTYIVKTSDLKRALKLAAPCIAKRGVVPVVEMLHLNFSDGLTIIATDLDQAVNVQIDAAGEGDISECLIDGKRLTALVNLMTEDEVKIEIIKDKVKLVQCDGTTVLPTADLIHYPETPKADDVEAWTIFDAKDLHKTFRTCLIGTTENDVGGGSRVVEVNIKIGLFECYATDGHRLSVINGKCEAAQDEPYKITIPVYAIRTLLPALEVDATIFVGENEKHIFVKLSDKLICSFRKMYATFPAVGKLLEDLKYERVLMIEAEEMVRPLETIRQIADKASMRSDWEFFPDGITLSAQSSDGSVKKVVSSTLDFGPEKATFNFSYLLPVFRQMNGEVEVAFSKDHIIRRDREDETKILDEFDSWTIRVTSDNGVKSSVIVQGMR